MSSKWLQRLLAHKQGFQAGEGPTLKTLETTDAEVLKVLEVADLPARPIFHRTSRVTEQAPPLLAAYTDARQQMEAEIPMGVSTLHWDQALTDIDRFLAIWGSAAAHLGWPVADIFEPPKNWVGGLAWELRGGEVVAFARSKATIEREGQLSWFCIASHQPVSTTELSAFRPTMKPAPWRRRTGSDRLLSDRRCAKGVPS
ncbi:hypothetical protein [Xanthobacter sp. KR7-225]|uniref:hypothetical protein n=1 Tax=Xanthobacter sp. KR7-225 TaxID=3156613 RepID=UPI0032B39DE9